MKRGMSGDHQNHMEISQNIIFTLKNDFFLKFLLIVGTKKGGLGTNLSTKKVH